MKRMTRLKAIAVVVLSLIGVRAFAESSPQILVDSDLRNGRWGTVFTNTIDLAWEWGDQATKAQLDITGMDGTTFTTNFTKTVSNYLWQPFASDTPSSEDVYDLMLTLSTDDQTTVGVLTSRLAVVRGAFGATVVNAVPDSPAWTKVKENVVIPYSASFSETAADALAAQIVIAKQGGALQTNVFVDVAGYYGWKIRHSSWGYGTFDLELTFPGISSIWTAELVRQADGLMFEVR